MKKNFYLITLFFLICLVLISILPQTSLAYGFSDITNFYGKTGTEAGLQQKQAEPIIAGLIKAFLTLVGALFVVLFIYAGVVWLTSAGNEEKIGTAKKTMSYAVMGLFVIVAAYSITFFITLAIESSPQQEGPAGTETNDCNEAGGACTTQGGCLAVTGAEINLDLSFACAEGQVCCIYGYEPPVARNCSECGQGAYAICDAIECKGIKASCVFCPGYVGGQCFDNMDTCQNQCPDPELCY
ncbi:MAG TPA: hypothetical protein ENN28_00230 [Candidatus Uhrbacteria bacterium]|nr:hypothetical protein [Candidatus Uhrbacteria bacterium]